MVNLSIHIYSTHLSIVIYHLSLHDQLCFVSQIFSNKNNGSTHWRWTLSGFLYSKSQMRSDQNPGFCCIWKIILPSYIAIVISLFQDPY